MVRQSGGTQNRGTSAATGKCWDWGNSGDESDREIPHDVHRVIHGLIRRGVDQPQRWYCHCLEGGGGMEYWRGKKLHTKCGEFHYYYGVEEMYVVGAYVTTNDQYTVHQVEKDLERWPEWTEIMIVGYLNDRLTQPHEICADNLETITTNHSLKYQTCHFIPRICYRKAKGWTWRMWRDRRSIKGRGKYILISNRWEFYNLSIREPRI